MSYDELQSQRVTVCMSAKKHYLGTVLKIGKDFLLIDEEQLGMLMLPVEHIKQIKLAADNARSKSKPRRPQKYGSHDIEFIPDTFHDVLLGLSKMVVQIESGGSEPTVGYLLDTQQDYLSLCIIPDGLVYFPIRHVFAVLLLDVNILPEFIQWAEERQTDWVPAACFEQLLQHEIGAFVTLGRGSPEDVTGLIQQVNSAYVQLITAPHEKTWIPAHHVKSLSKQVPFDWLPTTTL